MNTGRLLGLVVFAIGVVCLVFGIVSTDSVADQLSKTFTGEFTEETNYLLISGIIASIVGAGMVLFGGSRSKA